MSCRQQAAPPLPQHPQLRPCRHRPGHACAAAPPAAVAAAPASAALAERHLVVNARQAAATSDVQDCCSTPLVMCTRARSNTAPALAASTLLATPHLPQQSGLVLPPQVAWVLQARPSVCAPRPPPLPDDDETDQPVTGAAGHTRRGRQATAHAGASLCGLLLAGRRVPV